MKPEIVDSIAQYCSSMSTNLGDLTKCEEPGQLCIGLSKEMKEYYKNQCARTTSTMGNGSDPKDAEFCLQLTKD